MWVSTHTPPTTRSELCPTTESPAADQGAAPPFSGAWSNPRAGDRRVWPGWIWEVGTAVLHHATRSCSIDLVRLVINHGADIRSIDKYKRSAVHHLAAGDETGFESKDLTCIFNLIYTDAGTTLLNAEYDAVEAHGGVSSSASLHRHIAIPIAIEKRNWKLFKILSESNAALPKGFSSLLNCAIQAVQLTAVHFLVEHGAKIHREGDSPHGSHFSFLYHHIQPLQCLHSAIRQLRSSMNAEDLGLMLEDLIKIGLDVNQRMDLASKTVLDAAATHINSKLIAEVLLKNGADPYDNTGDLDVFLVAAIHGNLDFLHGLLRHAPETLSGRTLD